MEIIINKHKIILLKLGIKCLINNLTSMKEALNNPDINPNPDADVMECIEEQIELCHSLYFPLDRMAESDFPIQIETCPTKHPINHA